ncbi:MAG TPA: glycosyltransferase family 87 protein, partial [Candidatus Baltobacteraceae bacterium]
MKHKLWAVLLGAAVIGTLVTDRLVLDNRALLTDFRAFYCAGAVRDVGANPYLVEPLRRCEDQSFGIGQPPAPGIVVPAPLPGYDLALFEVVAKLPFPVAALVWELLSTGALIATIILLTKLTELEPIVIAATLLLSVGVASLFFGQLVPLSIALLCAAMLCVTRDRPRLAALFAVLSLAEPHLGAGAVLALFLFVPRARVVVLLAGSALLVLSMATNGIAGEMEYFKEVVPAHVLSEVNNDDQFSLTYLAKRFGQTDGVAVALGECSYIAMLALGLLCAGRIAKRMNEPALLVAVPTAFLLLGGPFVHIHQIAAALPAALLLFARCPERRRIFGIAAFLLAIPWIHIFLLLQFGLALAIVSLLLSAQLLRLPLAGQAGVAFASLAIVIAGNILFVPPPPLLAALSISASVPAEAVWRLYIDARHTSNGALFLALKMPTWLA